MVDLSGEWRVTGTLVAVYEVTGAGKTVRGKFHSNGHVESPPVAVSW